MAMSKAAMVMAMAKWERWSRRGYEWMVDETRAGWQSARREQDDGRRDGKYERFRRVENGAVGERRTQKQEGEKMSNGTAGALVVVRSVGWKKHARRRRNGAAIA
jgi:hypothetical protein